MSMYTNQTVSTEFSMQQQQQQQQQRWWSVLSAGESSSDKQAARLEIKLLFGRDY